MTDDAELDAAADRAFALLERAGGDVLRLDEPEQTVVVIYSAQGVIDNGGLRAFFAADWPGQPPYSLHIAAYRRIGAAGTAGAIDEGAALFAFPHPERDAARRNQAITAGVGDALDALAGDNQDDVWLLLAGYVARHRHG